VADANAEQEAAGELAGELRVLPCDVGRLVLPDVEDAGRNRQRARRLQEGPRLGQRRAASEPQRGKAERLDLRHRLDTLAVQLPDPDLAQSHAHSLPGVDGRGTRAVGWGIHTPAAPRLVAGLVERPRLFDLLDRGAQGPVTLLCAPAGSGKSMLLSSWLTSREPSRPVAWVRVERGESDATRFWGTVMDALRRSGAIATDDPLATLLPHEAQDEFLQRLQDGLGQLPRTLLLILDDLHQLRSDDALAGLERLLEHPPPQLRTLVASRHDPKLGLHRMRLAGDLTEIRATDLEFTPGEAAELIAGAGVSLAAEDLARLHERTEGWAAGLRLAAMSLARDDAPERFVAEFSGSERTIADYLVGEVLASHPPEVRDLLLRTCILERVNAPLADLLTGRRDGTRRLGELEEANALVVADDVARSWFRYHHLLADLLRLELRREAPDEVGRLHRLAAGWYAEHGHSVAAIRHAQLAEDYEFAIELLGRHWVQLILDGEEATLATLLADLPAGLEETDPELASIAAADHLTATRWDEADALLARAERAMPELPETRRRRAETALATVQLMRARRIGDLQLVVEAASRMVGGGDVAGTELRALALMNLGLSEIWVFRLADAESHLEAGLELAGRIGRPMVEVGCLGGLGMVANLTQRLDLAEDRLRKAIAVSERVGWATHPIVGGVYLTLAAVALERGRLTEGEGLLDRADPILQSAPEPALLAGLRHAQGMLAMARRRFAEAHATFRDGERLASGLRAPHFLAFVERQWWLRAQLRLGDGEPARAALADADDHGAWRSLAGHLALAAGDAQAAAEAVAPVLAGTAPVLQPNQEIEALLIDGLARTRLGEVDAAERSVERALALAEPQGRVWIFLTVPGADRLLAAHPLHRTAHAAHLKHLLDHLAGVEPSATGGHELAEPLSDRELAVLRFLPTNLSAAEIGSELFLSVHTVKTHMRKLYAKLDVHTRAEAVQSGRALGLLAPARRS
jgi:LuxR family maltose regulon positive regulatory protein